MCNDALLEIVTERSRCLVEAKEVQRVCRKLYKECVTTCGELGQGIKGLERSNKLKEHELVFWFTWLQHHLEQWMTRVLQRCPLFVFVDKCQNFCLRFQKTVSIILLSSKRTPLTSVPNITKIVVKSIETLKQWLVASEKFIERVIQEEELLLQANLKFL
jgi:hypothetical protein